MQGIGRETFERLYAEHARPLLAFLVYRTGDPALAEDLLADTFERVLERGGSFDAGRGNEKTWVYGIALNRLRDHARRTAAEVRALERVASDERSPPSSPMSGFEERDALSRALACLSDDEREAVALRYGADMTIKEIANVIRRPTTTVKGRLYHALARIRDELD